jgi:2-haloacid dehalogenase
MSLSNQIDFTSFSHLTFDCYGTLIDWERGILEAVGGVLARHGLTVPEEQIIRLYASFEAEIEAGPYRKYAEVLRGVMHGFGLELGFEPNEEDLEELPASVGSWPAFPDSSAALERLASRYKLVVLSNIDDAMFVESRKVLGVGFDDVITAEQIGSYKPAARNFKYALERLGVAKTRVLHVAQSLYHDHAPAKRLGLATAWVNRPSRCPGVGVAPVTDVVPDLEVESLEALAGLCGL